MPRIGTGLGLGLFRAAAGGSAFDADAQAFFDRVTTAGGTLSTTEKNATNQLVLDMKSAGIWSSMKAVYPMVGASAAACAQNLKSSSFTGTFSSGWTFASTGVTGNGSSTYMNTTLTPNGTLLQNSTHISIYSRTDTSAAGVDMGTNIDPRLYLLARWNSYHANNGPESPGVIAFTNSSGWFLNNRVLSTQMQGWRNTTKITDSTTASATSSGLSNSSLYIGAYNNNPTPALVTNKEYAFASIGDGLTDTQASDLYTAVNSFQVSLSRNV